MGAIEPTPRSSNAEVARNSMQIMVAQALGILFGVGLDIMAAAAFGIGLQMDAFFVALAIPQLLMSVLMSNGIRSLAPLFTESLEVDGPKQLTVIFSSTVNYLGLWLAGLAGVGILVAAPLVSLMAPGLSAEGQALAAVLCRILFISLVPLAIAEPLKAWFVFRQRFFLATLANFLRYTAGLIVLYLLKGSMGILALGWAHVAGSAVPAAIYAVIYFRQGGVYRLTLGRQVNATGLLYARLGPPTVGELLGQSNILVERFLASFLPPGIISALGYGRRMLAAFNGIIINSIAVAILPRLSLEAVAGELARVRQSVFFGVRLLALILGAIVAVMIGASHTLVTLLYQRGAFGAEATTMTATVFALLAPLLLWIGLTQLLMAPFFAFGETRIVLHLRILSLVVYALLSLALLQVFDGYGLALALNLSVLTVTLVWLAVLSRRIGGYAPGFYSFLRKLLGMLGVVALVAYGASRYAAAIENTFTLALYAVGSSLVIVALYAGLALWLNLLWRGQLLALGRLVVANVGQIWQALGWRIASK